MQSRVELCLFFRNLDHSYQQIDVLICFFEKASQAVTLRHISKIPLEMIVTDPSGSHPPKMSPTLGPLEARVDQIWILEKLLEGFSFICGGICALSPPKCSPAEKLMLHVVVSEMKTQMCWGMLKFPQAPALGAQGWNWLCQSPH